MTDEQSTPDTNSESYILAAAMFARFLAAYKAEDPDAARMLADLSGEPRSFGLTLRAAAEMFLGVLERLDRDGVVGGVQTWLDRQAMSYGAASDAIVARYHSEGGDE